MDINIKRHIQNMAKFSIVTNLNGTVTLVHMSNQLKTADDNEQMKLQCNRIL